MGGSHRHPPAPLPQAREEPRADPGSAPARRSRLPRPGSRPGRAVSTPSGLRPVGAPGAEVSGHGEAPGRGWEGPARGCATSGGAQSRPSPPQLHPGTLRSSQSLPTAPTPRSPHPLCRNPGRSGSPMLGIPPVLGCRSRRGCPGAEGIRLVPCHRAGTDRRTTGTDGRGKHPQVPRSSSRPLPCLRAPGRPPYQRYRHGAGELSLSPVTVLGSPSPVKHRDPPSGD